MSEYKVTQLPGVVRVSMELGGRELILETGVVARQAGAAVMASYAGTTVLATALRAAPREGIDFFPLTVDYREKTSAAGKFPGGFKKREGPPSEKEILTMRMIDRPMRPLFPDGFLDEVQVQVFVMSHDTENDADVLAGTAAAAALAISDIPFEGPTATVRVGRIHTEAGPQYVINPTISQLDYSDLDLVLAGHKDGINMIEVGAAEVDEAGVLGAMEFGYRAIKQVLGLIDELAAKVGRPKVAGELHLPSPEITAKVKQLAESAMLEARKIPGKQARNERVDQIKKEMLDTHFALKLDGNYGQYLETNKARTQAKEAFRRLEEKVTRRLIVEQKLRADGRKPLEIRPITGAVGVFARTHGSAFFQRGETQSLCSVTLGTGKDEQIVDGLLPEYSKKFLLHYNFPPFSTGEVKRIAAPGRREIGHGALAERSLLGVLPSPDEFPYTVRVVSDITESNGSSSMASVCGGCLALMDAGVPIKGVCAGISVGRFADDNDQNELFVTDIIGEEDFFGDMDFKVAGTATGVTALQMDIKINGITKEIMEVALAQAKTGRMHILECMNEVLSAPRSEMSEYAPRIITIKIDPDKIRDVIGKGGSTIRQITEETGTTIDISDDGTVKIASVDFAAGQEAKRRVEAITADVQVGAIYQGRVQKLMDFGAFVNILPGKDGLVHISQISHERVENVSDKLSEGDTVKVRVLEVDKQGRIRLSMKAVDEAN